MKNEITATKEWKHLDLELAYLAALTREGLKPLSRWETNFNRTTEEILHELGLQTRAVERTVQSGKRLRELLFSTSEECLHSYTARFADTPVNRRPDTVRLEGLLFGYPPCCVESYVARGYARNALRRRDQRILFHWACPQCAITPLLVPHYRRIYRACRVARRGRVWAWMSPIHAARTATPLTLALSPLRGEGIPQPPAAHRPELSFSPSLGRALAMAASFAAMGLGSATTLFAAPAADPLDPHVIAFSPADDPDRDFLSSSEEIILGMNPAVFDENANAVPDGVDLARALSAAIDALPTTHSATQPYVQHHLAFGLENCQVCGAVTNMGSLEIVNPLENQSFAMPYVAKHFLEHGSFSYLGTNLSGILHSGRLNPPLLQTALTSAGLAHFIAEPKGTDADNDGLRQWEEPALGTDPETGDSDGDQLIDGIDLARTLRRTLDTLPRTPQHDRPYVLDHPMDGYEICPRCGERVVMDMWEVINPLTGDSITLPSMALHYLEHGGCGWKGGQLLGGEGRVDPRHLQAVLIGQPNRHLLPVTPDADRDLLADQEEQDLGKDPLNPDEDRNAVSDGLDLARATVCAIAALPTKPSSNQVHRLDFPLRGLERCDLCGTNVNMGHLTVCNPLAQLYAKLPYIALHYLEHDSFSFAGDVHGTGRSDVKLLLDALHSPGPSHRLPVSGDTDADGLKDHEERHFGTDPAIADSNLDGLPDGFALAHEMWREVEVLPRPTSPGTPPINRPCYAVDHRLRGVVPCSVCGAMVNMGWVEVINPRECVATNLSYLALHFMRHGSFASSSLDRVNPCLLDVALHGDGTSHLVVWPGDSDHDGLLDAEEAHFGTRPDTADTNGDGVLDGIDLVRRLHQRIQALPISPATTGTYRIPFEANCLAPCPVCGEEVNCGHVVITNAWSGLSSRVSFMNLHFLEHGSLAASATERVDPILLDTILQPAVTIVAEAGGVTLRWLGQVGRTYQVFTSEEVSGGWTPGPTFSGAGSELVFTDADTAGRPRRFYQVRRW